MTSTIDRLVTVAKEELERQCKDGASFFDGVDTYDGFIDIRALVSAIAASVEVEARP